MRARFLNGIVCNNIILEIMREYIVRVLQSTYKILANDRYHALSQAVRLYLKDHPDFSFTVLMSLGSAKLVHPEPVGRKSVDYV